MLENRHVHHHREESKQSENDEVFHHLGLGFLVGGIALATKDEGFVGVTESLGDHRHNHRNFDAGAVDAQLYITFLTRNDETVAYLVGYLVEDASQTQKKEWPRITQHLLQHLTVDSETQLLDFRDETKGNQARADEVDNKNIADLVTVLIPAHQTGMALFQSRSNQENKQIQPDVEEDKQELQRGEFDGFVFIA